MVTTREQEEEKRKSQRRRVKAFGQKIDGKVKKIRARPFSLPLARPPTLCFPSFFVASMNNFSQVGGKKRKSKQSKRARQKRPHQLALVHIIIHVVLIGSSPLIFWTISPRVCLDVNRHLRKERSNKKQKTKSTSKLKKKVTREEKEQQKKATEKEPQT